MERSQQKHIGFLVLFFVLMLVGLGDRQAYGSICADGVAEPPFLSYGVDPNVLLMIDNSGSMYDLAYIQTTPLVGTTEPPQCYDESYDTTGGTSYAGYFDNDTWYAYNSTDGRFEEPSAATLTSLCGAEYYAVDTSTNKYLCLDVNTGTTPTTVVGFAAKGNFLNWATASKFDIQKKILTGGKYDSSNEVMILESRGCSGRRFVKQVTLAQLDGVEPYKLALGIRGPMEVFAAWRTATAYVVGDIVQYGGILYKANTAHTSAANFVSDYFTNGYWDEYKDTRWYPGHTYPAGAVVYDKTVDGWFYTEALGTSPVGAADITEDNVIDWQPFNGTYIEIFDSKVNGYDVTSCQLAIEELGSLDGSVGDGSSSDGSSSLGKIKGYTEDCMGYDQGSPNTEEGYQKSAFNHSMQECWYYNKFGIWQPGSGSVNAIKNDCENMYASGIKPEDISPWESGYICAGSYTVDIDKSGHGYVGRCWEQSGVAGACAPAECPPGGSSTVIWDEGTEQYVCDGPLLLYVCNKNNCAQLPAAKPGDWDLVEDCPPGGGNLDQLWTDDDFYYSYPCTYSTCTENDALLAACPDTNDPLDTDWTCTVDAANWTCHEPALDGDNITDYCFITDNPDGDSAVDADNGDRCIDQALKDFCNIVSVPEVIDPSDSTSLTGTTWNAPAMLVDSGVLGQLDQPLATMRGMIKETTAPEGLIQDFADDLRIGAMTFNDNGAAYECTIYSGSSSAIAYDCPSSGNQDGGQVIAEIDQSAAHTASLVSQINAIVANSWTPLAEAMYNAIGYYGQDITRRLNADDFTVGTDPVQYWCQDNNIVVITEGFSTADMSPTVENFVTATANNDTADDLFSTTTPSSCGDLYYSTWFDDLTYFAKNADLADLYTATQQNGENKQKIKTHIVMAGTARTIDTTTTIAECSPDTLMANAATNGGTSLYDGSDASSLQTSLQQVFNEIRAGASAGSAASVISSSRGGEGAIYQAIFWKSREPSSGTADPVSWVGEVHGLFISAAGSLYEDTNGNRKLDLEDTGSGTDNKVIIYFDESDNVSKACYGDLIIEDKDADEVLDVGEDFNGNNQLDPNYCNGTSVSMEDVKYMWSANDWLAKISHSTATVTYAPYSVTDEYLNRAVVGSSSGYVSNTRRRYIFTWNDLDNDGIVDTTVDINGDSTPDTADLAADLNGDASTTETISEIIPLVSRDAAGNPVDWSAFPVKADRSSLIADFNAASNAEVNKIIDWLRGVDQAGYRPRVIKKKVIHPDGDTDADNVVDFVEDDFVWRMGDVIHSTPTAVAKPAENLDVIYSDTSYRKFSARWAQRRHMAYFGGNDGMLHAVNGGFYKEAIDKFCLVPGLNAAGDDCGNEVNQPELGAEMFAYVPYNLLPHLKCLTNTTYKDNHKYYVDLRPRVFDAKIFTEESECSSVGMTAPGCIHPYGWGTVLVGGMRFGGAPVDANTDLPGANAADQRNLVSSYFVMDITNPEAPPVLLAEMTDVGSQTNMGFTTANPTPVVMQDENGTPADSSDDINNWYLMLGSGPANATVSDAMKAESDQKPRVAVLPFDWLTGATKRPFRIPTTAPTDDNDLHDSSTEGGVFVMNNAGNGFVSDLITVDTDLAFELDEEYKADVVYFGTVEGSFAGGWDGSMYRIVTRALDFADLDNDGDTDEQKPTEPGEWATLTPADGTGYLPLIYAGQPITAAASPGTDLHNLWIYFGTGRFFDADDKNDAQPHSYYGIKEPTDCATNEFTWGTVTNVRSGSTSVTNYGTRGLADVTDVYIQASGTPYSAVVCDPIGSIDCLADVNNEITFQGVQNFIAGFGHDLHANCRDEDNDITTDSIPTGKDGWVRDFPYSRERNLGQATLLGGLVTFTTYQPFSDPCQQEGLAYLYGLYYQTGTAWHTSIFGDYGVDANGNVQAGIALGRGLATTPNLHIGSGEGATAFVQTSTGEIREIDQTEMPISNFKSGKFGWREILE
ncbi:MAG: hypothetical protein OEY01_15160 [Desulfobulbaceae bacterium]|nr:hypothetical protein [Desulfobulbaceae bacterium]